MDKCRIHDNSSLIGSKSLFAPTNNPPVIQSDYLNLDSHNIDTCTLKISCWILHI